MKFDCWRYNCIVLLSHPVRGAWIEILFAEQPDIVVEPSHPVRGAWIEISELLRIVNCPPKVASRKGCVD